MKIFKFIIPLFALAVLYSFISKEKIAVKIIIENPENINFKSGKLFISKTKEQIEITDLTTKEISLESGKHDFKFISETPNYITYPKKIDSKNNTIKIRLLDSKTTIESGFATEKNFEDLLKSKKLQFINFGIVSHDNNEFEKKYGISVKYEGCVITPFLSEQATINNQLIANHLTKSFGDSWKKDLGFLPFGL